MRISFILTSLLIFSELASAQVPDTIPLPILMPNSVTLYVAIDGQPGASGDSLTPVPTFGEALDRLVELTDGVEGDVWSEIVMREGSYAFALAQPVNRYLVEGRRLNVSVRGVGEVNLDGTSLNLGGSGMVHLLGSHISVRNLRVLYSPANGVRFGWNFNGTVISSHDIVIEDVEVMQTSGHGIIVGISPVHSGQPFTLSPRGERYVIRRCHVHESVNYNQPASQWGSAIKFHHVRYGLVEDCYVHDNGGEGINVDFGEHILIRNNEAHDNHVNVYLDKATSCRIEGNLLYHTSRTQGGILMGIEPFVGWITDYYIKDIGIYNNVIINTVAGISVWQGTYSALQNGFFTGIDMRHNTIFGKQTGNGDPVHFTYFTFLGQPAPNIHFSSNTLIGNIVSAHPDSLNNGRLFGASANPQPGLTTGYNLWGKHPVLGYHTDTDSIQPDLPVVAQPSAPMTWAPHPVENPSLLFRIPNLLPNLTDYFGEKRDTTYTNAGAVDYHLSTAISSVKPTMSDLRIYPNPCIGQFTVESPWLDRLPTTIRLLNSQGVEVPLRAVWQHGTLHVMPNVMPPGWYILTLVADGHRVSAVVIAQ